MRIFFRPTERALATCLVAGLTAAGAGCSRSARLPEGTVLMVADTTGPSGNPAIDEAVRQTVIVGLQQTPYFSVVPEVRLRAQLRDMRRPADQPITLDVAREVCQRMKGRAIVSATLASRGDGFGLLLDAFECDSGNRIAQQETAVPARADLVAKTGEAVASLRASLGEPSASTSKYNAPLASALTASIEPLQAFALGAKARGAVGDEPALPFFQRATDLDGDFALAWSRLGVVAASTGRVGLSRRAAAKAYDLRTHATEYDRMYITWNHAARVLHDDAAARAALTALTSTYPRDFAARNNLGVYHVGHGEFEQALAEYRAAAALAPDEPVPAINIAYTLIFLRQRDEAYQTLSQVLRRRPDVGVGITRWLSAAIAGDPRAAEFEREAAAVAPPAQLDLARSSLALWGGKLKEYARLQGEIRAQTLAYKNDAGAAAIDANLRLTKAAFEQGPAMAALASSLKTTKPAGVVALGVVLLASLDDIASVKALLPLVDAEPEPGQSVVVSAAIAHAYVKAADGDAAGAVKDVEAVLVEFPQAIDTNFHLARLREKAGNLDGAIAAYQIVVQAQPVLGSNPAIAPARLYLARALTQKGDAAGAKEQLDALNAQWKDADTDFPWRQQARK